MAPTNSPTGTPPTLGINEFQLRKKSTTINGKAQMARPVPLITAFLRAMQTVTVVGFVPCLTSMGSARPLGGAGVTALQFGFRKMSQGPMGPPPPPLGPPVNPAEPPLVSGG